MTHDSLVLIVPGPLETLTGGYGYDRRIIAGLRDRDWSVEVRELDHTFPRPTAAACRHAASVLAGIPRGASVLIDGLALGALPAVIEREAARLRLVGLVHHPLALETGLAPDVAAELEVSERRALAAVRLVVVTSRATAALLEGYGVGADRIAVVEPGTDRAAVARGTTGGPPHLLSVAALIPRKGHDVLFRALATIADRDWRLTCVGHLERDPPTVDRLRAQLHALRLEHRVILAGEADPATVHAWYDRADVFVMPTLYEGYGMAVAEALAHGLPVIGTTTGALPELVGSDAGVLVPPGDPDALAAALARVVLDADFRDRLAAGARRVRERLPGWDDASEKLAVVLKRVMRDWD